MDKEALSNSVEYLSVPFGKSALNPLILFGVRLISVLCSESVMLGEIAAVV